MDDSLNFKQNAYFLVDWLEKYYSEIEEYPVLSQVEPGKIKSQLPAFPPGLPEDFRRLMSDFESIIVPGITHWQSPNYFAYFPANTSIPSVWAEILTAGLGIQAMKWLTSPAATELEQVVMEWLRKMIQLPRGVEGTIMDTASVSTLCALVAAREKATGYISNEKGLDDQKLRIYCSTQAHSSIEKAVRIIGIGSANLVKISTNNQMQLDTQVLIHAIRNDIELGYRPIALVGVIGTTATGSVDPIKEMADIAREFNCWLHIDAAFSGSALILPEVRNQIHGIELADSFVFNPHKWLFTNFDCSAFFVRDKKLLTRTFSLIPDYLSDTQVEADDDFSNWGIQLGRRFRALKLWFVIRTYGVNGLQEKLREHIRLASLFEEFINIDPHFELAFPRQLSMVCFRFHPGDDLTFEELNQLNENLLTSINQSGKLFMSHTTIDGKYLLRFVCAQTNTLEKHVRQAWEVIRSTSQNISLQ